MVNNSEFADKVILVTGAAGGIGEAAARAFAAKGAKVVLSDINEAGESTAKSIRENGGSVVFKQCDVSNVQSIAALFRFIDESFGKLDIAFNNAGVDIEKGKLADGTEDEYNTIMDINVKGVWLCMQQEIKSMLKAGNGIIVNTASVAGLGAAPAMSIYSASKHAVIGLTKSAAIEYARKGIRVNAICPAVIETNMFKRAVEGNPKKAAGIAAFHPIGRIGQASEVVAAVLFLCSEAAGFTTGVALPVDGGSTAI